MRVAALLLAPVICLLIVLLFEIAPDSTRRQSLLVTAHPDDEVRKRGSRDVHRLYVLLILLCAPDDLFQSVRPAYGPGRAAVPLHRCELQPGCSCGSSRS